MGYTPATMCILVDVPFARIMNTDVFARYPQTDADLARFIASEVPNPYYAGNDDGVRIAAMVRILRTGGKLLPATGEIMRDGRATIWDGYHRIAARAIAGYRSIPAWLAPPR